MAVAVRYLGLCRACSNGGLGACGMGGSKALPFNFPSLINSPDAESVGSSVSVRYYSGGPNRRPLSAPSRYISRSVLSSGRVVPNPSLASVSAVPRSTVRV